METIKVNMNPNPLDVQTIHASQNDNEAREWGFELHNNGDVIDPSSISDQMVFKAYEGGTEQILPENGSTPTTSPFLGDIRYPQGLLTDQKFTYRESPTESDGLAKITDIKGNTLVWNQLLQNGNFEVTTGWATSGRGTLTVSNNVATITPARSGLIVTGPVISITQGHKYLLSVELKADSTSVWVGTQYNDIHARLYSNGTNQWQRITSIVSNFANDSQTASVFGDGRTSGWTASQIRNFMFIDLTKMGLDSITDPSEFTSLFSLPYYAYNQGTLLSFNGNGIKTVSKNQFDTQVVTTSYQGLTLTKTQGTIRAVYSGGSQYAGFNFYGSPVFTDTFLKGKYRFSFDVSGLETQWTVGLRQGASFIGGGQAVAFSNNGHHSFTIDTEANPNCYFSFARTGNMTTAYDVTFSNIQLELGTVETPYTPFEEQTISLPISQYFPDGMDGVGTVYDELTNSGYAKRFARVTFDGTKTIESIVTIGSYTRITIAHGLPNVKYPNAQQRSNYLPYVVSFGEESSHFYMNGTTVIVIMPTSSLGSTRETANAYLQSNPLTIAYELTTPLENYGVVDLGTLNWTYNSTTGHLNFNSADINTLVKKAPTASTYANIVCSKYAVINENEAYFNTKVGIGITTSGAVRVYDPTYTDVATFKQAMQGVYLLYEKQNPQGFTTASLVTENAEIPLSNEDGTLIGKCTEQLSENPGFIDAKIKLADADGECYSNKIQLHVERSPQ